MEGKYCSSRTTFILQVLVDVTQPFADDLEIIIGAVDNGRGYISTIASIDHKVHIVLIFFKDQFRIGTILQDLVIVL